MPPGYNFFLIWYSWPALALSPIVWHIHITDISNPYNFGCSPFSFWLSGLSGWRIPFFANRFDSDDFSHRISSLVIMFLMITMSVFLGNDLFENYNWFIGFYLTIRIVLASLYFQNIGALERSRRFAKKAGMVVIFGALLAGISVFFQSPVWEIILLMAILVEIIIHYFNTRKEEVHNVHREHLVERIGLMSIVFARRIRH